MSDWQGLDEFVAVANAGSFSGGARVLGTSATRMSRVIALLELRLQAQLFDRTTRTVVLTDTGQALLDPCKRVLQERDDVLASVNQQGEPQGELRVTCSAAMGERFVAPILQRYAMRYPKLGITIELTNRIVDLVAEGYDLAIRTGEMPDSSLIRVRVASRDLVTCASPAYLDRADEVKVIDDLVHHECLIGTSQIWRFRDGERDVAFKPRGRWRCNSGGAVLQAALDNMGICQLPEFYVSSSVSDGRLVSVLGDCKPKQEAIWAVYPHRRHLLPKIRGAISILKLDLGNAIARAGADKLRPAYWASEALEALDGVKGR